MAKSKIVDTDRGWKAIQRRVRAMPGYAVKVGVLGGALHHSSDANNPVTVAEVAMANEFGTDRIPARPAFRQAADGMKRELAALAKRETAAVVDGDRKPETAFGRLGLFMQGRIQKQITDLDSPPNAPSTIAKKGSSNPLVDQGQLRQSVTFEVVKPGEKAVKS